MMFVKRISLVLQLTVLCTVIHENSAASSAVPSTGVTDPTTITPIPSAATSDVPSAATSDVPSVGSSAPPSMPTVQTTQAVESTAGSQPTSGPTAGSQPTSGPTAGSQSTSGPTAGSQPTSGPTAGSQPSSGPTAGSQPSSGPTAGSQPSSGPTAGSQPSSGPTAGSQPSPGPTDYVTTQGLQTTTNGSAYLSAVIPTFLVSMVTVLHRVLA